MRVRCSRLDDDTGSTPYEPDITPPRPDTLAGPSGSVALTLIEARTAIRLAHRHRKDGERPDNVLDSGSSTIPPVAGMDQHRPLAHPRNPRHIFNYRVNGIPATMYGA